MRADTVFWHLLVYLYWPSYLRQSLLGVTPALSCFITWSASHFLLYLGFSRISSMFREENQAMWSAWDIPKADYRITSSKYWEYYSQWAVYEHFVGWNWFAQSIYWTASNRKRTCKNCSFFMNCIDEYDKLHGTNSLPSVNFSKGDIRCCRCHWRELRTHHTYCTRILFKWKNSCETKQMMK